MPTTEFALLHLRRPPASPSLIQTLAAATRLQSAWHAARFPSQPSSPAARAALWFTSADADADAAWLLTTARWASTAAHWDWIRSVENRGVMEGLVGAAGEVVGEDTVLWHVGGDIFEGALGGSEVVSVERVIVGRGRRGVFAERWEGVRGLLERYAGPGRVRYGWREDVEEGVEEEEFVLVCGWESVERHAGFAETEQSKRFGEIWELAARRDVKHYKRLLLE